MRQKAEVEKPLAEAMIKYIRRATLNQFGAAEKIRIVLEGLRGQEPIAAWCRRAGIVESLHYLPPGDLEAQIEKFADRYNHRRYHERCDDFNPAAVYCGRALLKAARSQAITGSDPA